MLSHHKMKAGSAGSAAAYYERLGREDYYEKGGEPPGEWYGSGAAGMGLTGQLEAGQLGLSLLGCHPETGEQLVKDKEGKHAPGYDLVFTPPKSVSALWAVAPPGLRREIQAAHDEFVREALGYLEQHAFSTRYCKAGRERVPLSASGGMIAALYQHSTSRAADPNIHTHAIIANMTPEGRGIDYNTQWNMAGGMYYATKFSNWFKEHGFQIEQVGKEFEIVGVPEELREHWSKRREDIVGYAQETGRTTPGQMRVAALETRENKGEINRQELFAGWEHEGRKFGFGHDQIEVIKYEEPPYIPEPMSDSVLSALTEMNSTFIEAQLHAECFRQAQGVLTIDEAKALIDEARSQACALEHGRFTTKETLAMEGAMVARARRMKDAGGFEVRQENIDQAADRFTLTPEQRQAIQHIMEPGGLALVRGWAGTGKSHMLKGAKEAWESDGYKVIGGALQGKTAKDLETGSGIESGTLHALQHKIDHAKECGEPSPLDSKTVLVIDEAGMVGNRQLASLLKEAERAGAKVVLVGDEKQIQAVEAGGAFKGLAERLGAAEMSDVLRQRNQIDKDIAKDLREGRSADALSKLDGLGRLHVQEKMSGVRAEMAAAWREDVRHGKSSLMIVRNNDEARELNQAARNMLIEDGRVSRDGAAFQTERGEREFAAGDTVVFLQNDKMLGVQNGDRGQIIEAEPGQIAVEVDDPKAEGGKRVVSVDHQAYQKVDHGYAITGHKSQGQTVDRAHVLAGDTTGKEWGYVAGTRQREETHFYTTTAAMENSRSEQQGLQHADLTRALARSEEKSLAIDFKQIQLAGPTQSVQHQDTREAQQITPDLRTHEQRQLDALGRDELTHEQRSLDNYKAGMQVATDNALERIEEKLNEWDRERERGAGYTSGDEVLQEEAALCERDEPPERGRNGWDYER